MKASKAIPTDLPHEFIGRLFDRIQVGQQDECWEWSAGCVKAGYGVIVLPKAVVGRRQQVFAHRLICTLFHGEAPSPLHLALHSCDNPPCCNPSHLRWGLHADNMTDAAKRGRMKDNLANCRYRGEANATSKLTEQQVRAIRISLDGGQAIAAVAREHQVAPGTIRAIRDGRTWGHVK